ncbi:acyltransferase [Nocardia sp. NPDC052566]|uniref:phthiocerol/phthiodiolone dimycocerosyl transferase family protein n=1 Tax=Nocardia sp. NPDC052566 TaxID=3364330 RepID=UPI0037C8DFB7
MWWQENDAVRDLAPSEERFVRHGTYTGRSVVIEGTVDEAALGAAFDALQREYPVVTCRIGEDRRGRGHLLRPGRAVMGMQTGHGDAETIRIPSGPADPGTQLAYLDVVFADSGQTRLTLFVHHAVADAGHCVALLSRLWEHYTDYVETGTTTVVPQGHPKSLEWYSADHGILRGAVSSFEDVIRPLPSTPVVPISNAAAPAALVRPHRTVLDRVATARIVDLARHHEVTVNGLVTAALLRTFAAEKANAAGVPVNVGCLYPVDMRARLDPPVPAAAGTNMAGLASFSADIAPTADRIELARRISAKLRHDLAEGIVQQSVLHFPDFYGPHPLHSLAGHVAITNTGRVPAFRTPRGITLADYEIVYLSAHPRPSTGPSAAVTFLVYTFDGHLTVGILGAAAARLLGSVEAELASLSTESLEVEGRRSA